METKKRYTVPQLSVVSISTVRMQMSSPPEYGGEGGSRRLDLEDGEW